MAYSIGLGLTNECNLACAHCYRPTDGTFRLSLQDVRRTCDSLPIASANLGTGENGLHPEFNSIVEHLVGRGIQTSLTTNGYTVEAMPEPLLRSLREVEFSAVLGLNSLSGCACGRRTVRVSPKRRVIPCVYWQGNGLPLEWLWELGEAVFQSDDFCAARCVPVACHGCKFEGTCAGGCVGRRLLAGDITAPDPYCPILRHDALGLTAQMARGKSLLKSGSACTTILSVDGHRRAAP